MPRRKPSPSEPTLEPPAEEQLIPDQDHPDFVGDLVGGASYPAPGPGATVGPAPGPVPVTFPPPVPLLPICRPVSGRYSRSSVPGAPRKRPVPTVTVRVDVDRYLPQNRMSVEISRAFPRARVHAVAEVFSDQCVAMGHRQVHGRITYRDGDLSLLPGDEVLFEATRGRGLSYGAYHLSFSRGGVVTATYDLTFRSEYFDPVEFEVDRVANAGTAVTTYDTGSHPNRPAGLPVETMSLATVYQRAGFDVTMSANTTVIPTADAGSNGTWSDSEMHNAMVTYWSRFANLPKWAMWVLYAARHDQGRSLGGVMFDDIGPNHRQGTAIFTDSFIQDAPAGDPQAAAWRRRMVFWTAAHEMGHAFNLAHSWQKALGGSWVPLPDQPEARSFMNYPFRVSGGQSTFFADFGFRFTDEELVFMRHAPRSFVRMGDSDWFVNHAFEAPGREAGQEGWTLQIRPNRPGTTFAFMEPVVMELKLTNASSAPAMADREALRDGRGVSVMVKREGGRTRRWRPLMARCHEERQSQIDAGESVYGSHMISTSTIGWLIDEPGFYTVQAALEVDGRTVVSNVLRVYVSPQATAEQNALAGDYFTEDVARVIAFDGAPALTAATDTLREVVDRCPDSAAAVHATVALTAPQLRDYKVLAGDATGLSIASVTADVAAAAQSQSQALLSAPAVAADTMGHIDYFGALDRLADSLAATGAVDEAKQVMQASVTTMRERDILGSVVAAAESRLDDLE